MKTIQKILLIAAAAVTALVSEPAMAQNYQSDSLLATNSFFATWPTNLVSANYFVSQNGSASYGSGIFVNPLNSPLYSAEGGVTYQLLYTQTANTNSANVPLFPITTNIVATFGLLLDDATLKQLGSLSTGALTNTTYTITFQVLAAATNTGTYYSAIAQGPLTNSIGAKYSKLIGFTATGYTNGLTVQSLRIGYPLQ